MDGPRAGPWNMAADSFLLDSARTPTLRLYQWDGPWLSLGYAQKPVPAEIPWVRRPSGGRAVLHHHEITYAIVLPEFSGSLGAVYEQLTALWLETLAALHPQLSSSETQRSGQGNPSCYQLTQRGEIQLQGQKLVGSAQLRRGTRLLQHGSIPTAVSPWFSRTFPGARPPAVLPGLTSQDLVRNFPRGLQRQDWSPEEVGIIEENACAYRA
ncbi:lipoate--protein ligase family protein [bacterium]|nr:lipoate--protein ligase family protein [bacterium]